MKILTVLAHPPLPEGGAPGKCAFGLIRGLLEHGLEPRVLVGRDIFMLRGIPVLAGSEGLPRVPFEVEAIGNRGRFVGYDLRRPMARYREERFLSRVREMARSVDVVQLEQTQLAYSAHGIDTPSVVHIHSLARRDRGLGWPWQGGFWSMMEFILAERAAGRHHRHLIASSPLVADDLRRLAPKAEVVLASLTIDPDHYEQAGLDGPPIAGIIGTGYWPPTARAMRRLVDRVWPLVRREVAEARLLVAGRALPAGLGPAEGVEVLGQVPSAAAFFQELGVLLYPLDHGSGMKVKVLEAIASGVPVVTTREGAEGIAPNDGVVVEDSDDRIAVAAAAILSDPAERQQRGTAARRAFEREHAPKAATEPLIDLYRRMAGS